MKGMATSMERLEMLRESGMPAAQAEAVLRAVEEVSEASLLRNWMVDTFATKVELAEVKADLVKWMAGLGITIAGLSLAGVYFLLAHFKT